MDIKQKIVDIFADKKSEIFELSSLCGRHEKSIENKLFELLKELDQKKTREYEGLFGWENFKPDKCININGYLLIIEVKKVTEKSEYGSWHAIIQGVIYSFLEKKLFRNKNFLVLCIILDWGRKAGQTLNENEKNFIDQFKFYQIYFLRVNMIGEKFIEHNLSEEWQIIKSN